MRLRRHPASAPRAARALLAAVVVGLALLVGASAAHAQNAAVTVKVSPKVVLEGEDVTVEVTFRGDYDNYALPELGDFKVLGRQQSSQISIVGGNVSQTRTFTIRAIPKKTGILTVGAAKVLRSGSVVATSKPQAVKVRKEAPPDPSSAKSGSASALQTMARTKTMFIHGATPRSTVYVGEPFVLSWDVYLATNFQLEDFSPASAPNLDGFLAEEIPDAVPRNRLVSRRRKVVGRSFNSYRTGAKLLTPLKPGRVLVDAMSAEIGYSERRRFGFSRRKVLRSRPFYIEVKPLPKGAPKGFEPSNIGDFRMTVSLRDARGQEPRTLQTGQRLVLKVTVSGNGNIGGMSTPVVGTADGRFEVQQLPSGKSDNVLKSVDGVEGTRHFEYLLTPLKPGNYESPNVTLVYFDPATRAYKTAVGKGRPVKVSGAPLSAGARGAAGAGGGASDIGPIVEKVELSHHSRGSLATTPLFWLLFAVPLLGFVAVEVRFRRRRREASDPLGRKSRGAVGNARKRLSAAEQALKDGLVKDFYGQIARTLIHFFEERVHLPATGQTHDELRRAAQARGFSAELMDEVITELENCDFARFAPAESANADMKATVDRVEALIAKLAGVKPVEPAAGKGT